jgi:translation initiation factor 3 subunit L
MGAEMIFHHCMQLGGECEFELPNQWLWDIIDEFVYQFQSFAQYRNNLKNKTDAELELLKKNPDVWNVQHVLEILYSLLEKANIEEQLIAIKKNEDVRWVY